MAQRVCVNMIVKNEAAIIERCCVALARTVDCYVICDTGSSDDTVERITKVFARHGIPGEIVHTTFVNFEQARNEALDAARGSSLDFEYILLCDADMELEVVDPNWKSQLGGPAYGVVQRSVGGLEYPNVRLVRRDHPAHYVGVTHEYLDIGVNWQSLDGIRYVDHAAGSNRAVKFERDIRLLTEALEREPDNSRSVFYLANSYFDIGDNERAIEVYQRRLAMDGYQDERFISMYRIGIVHQRSGNEASFFHQMLTCYDAFPLRAESVHRLALHAQQTKRHHLALGLARMVVDLPKPENGLFVEAEVYEWRLEDIIAVSLYWTGKPREAIPINERLLGIVPEDHRARIADNIQHCRRAAVSS